MRTVHEFGAIIGDVKEGGAMVDQEGLVTLIDSDSFQYGGYRCEVGKEWRPIGGLLARRNGN